MQHFSVLVIPVFLCRLFVLCAVEEFDADKDGLIGYDEFAAILARDGDEGTDAVVRAAVLKNERSSGAESAPASTPPATETAASSAPPTASQGDDSDRILAAFSLFDVDGDVSSCLPALEPSTRSWQCLMPLSPSFARQPT